MADESTPDVLTSLPRTRPQRRSAKRDATRAKPAAAKPAPKGKATPKAKAKTTPAKAAAKPRAKAPAEPKAAPKPKLPPAGFETPRSDAPGPPSGVEIVGTAIQAAGELAQIGAAIGKQTLKSVLRIGR